MEKLTLSENGKERKTLSSSSSSSSSCSSGSSSSSSSSDSSDTDGTVDPSPGYKTLSPPKNEKPVRLSDSGPSSSNNSNPTANRICSGSFINEVRLVPINVKKKKAEKKNGLKKTLTLRERKVIKKDPTFKLKEKSERSHVQVKQSGCESSRDEGDSSNSKSLSTEPVEASTRSLRNRTKNQILNDKFIFDLQHEKFVQELNKRQEARKPKEENFDFSQEEIDTDIPSSLLRISGRTADWDDFLNEPGNYHWIAPVSCFKHASFSRMWDTFAKVGVKIEIPNPFVQCDRPVYWVATIRAFAGYKALVQYETFGSTVPYCGWMSYCSDVPKPIGYCDKNKILLFPPYEVYRKNKDFLKKMREILAQEGVSTLNSDHVETVTREILSARRFKIMETVEAMDSENPSQNLLANVTGIVGDRIHVSYGNNRSSGFWFNVNSPRVHHIGWSQSVGHRLTGVPQGTEFLNLEADYFPSFPSSIKINRGQVFEVIHPIHLDRIVAARVGQVYKHGYFLAQIDCNPPLVTLSFCYHITSAWILPVGFAQTHSIPLGVPTGEKEDTFKWEAYCFKKNVTHLDLSMLQRPPHKFCTGAKIEAIDLRQPTYCGPATVIQIAEHLLLLHFDGWNRNNPQSWMWVDAESNDIYPAGWAEMVGHAYQSSPSKPRPEDGNVSIRKFLEGA